MNYTKGERKHTQPDANGGVNVFTDEEHIAYFTSLGDALLDIAAPNMYEALKQYERMGFLDEFPTYLQGLRNIIDKAEGKQ